MEFDGQSPWNFLFPLPHLQISQIGLGTGPGGFSRQAEALNSHLKEMSKLVQRILRGECPR